MPICIYSSIGLFSHVTVTFHIWLLLFLPTVTSKRLYHCKYVTYRAIAESQSQIGCRYAVLNHIHSVSLCGLECKARECIYFSINVKKECVLCEKETGYPSLEDIREFGITLDTSVYINNIDYRSLEPHCGEGGGLVTSPFEFCQCQPQLFGNRCDRGIYHVNHTEHAYNYTFAEGQAECSSRGMQVATLDQLTAAYNRGYELCVCGWISDGVARYPMQVAYPDCGDFVGINTCGWKNTWNVYCYRE